MDMILRCHDLAQVDPDTKPDADSLIGFFQAFRPDGAALHDLFDELDCGDDLFDRLSGLYEAAGEDRRPNGGRDAYFVVRDPDPVEPVVAESYAMSWIEGIREIAQHAGNQEILDCLTPIPAVRVLEGKPPKHPKDDSEKSKLLKAIIYGSSELLQQLDQPDSIASVLRNAYYFIACDAMLRDYLMWPLYRNLFESNITDPLKPYFQLWQHGVKFRIYGEKQVDLYLPRHASESPGLE